MCASLQTLIETASSLGRVLLSARLGEGLPLPDEINEYIPSKSDAVAMMAEGPIVVGSRVRVRASVSSPSSGWGSVSHADVGTVASISGER